MKKDHSGREKWNNDVPASHTELIEQRLEEYRKNPSNVRTWEEMKKSIMEEINEVKNSKTKKTKFKN